MARSVGLYTGAVGVIRQASAVIAADSATLTDANFDPAAGFNGSGFDSIFIGVEITAGSAPTMTIEFLFRDANAPDGSRWKRMLLGARDGVTASALVAEDSGALDGTSFVEMHCFGQLLIFPRIKAVANSASTTAWKILAIPGRPRNVAGLSRT